jgi:hypothetical protein
MKKENNKQSFSVNGVVVFFGFISLTLVACAPNSRPSRTALDDQPPRMVSAFFGLDNAIEGLRYKGADGMPVTFSKRVQDPSSLEPEAFTVITLSGSRVHPLRATTRPADEVSKRHTVLLIGEFGNEPEDPPVKVEVTGNLILAGGDDARGLSVKVTPLIVGPSLVMAYAVNPKDLAGDFPPETKQIIVAIWNGGVQPIERVTYKNHLQGYSVETSDGKIVQPIGLGDIGGDNYEYLYLDTEATALRVSMKSNLLMDPRSDGNLATSIEVAGASVLNGK